MNSKQLSQTVPNTSSQNLTVNGQLSGAPIDPISCFTVENDSFLEVRDCFIKSIKDKNYFDQELDKFITSGRLAKKRK